MNLRMHLPVPQLPFWACILCCTLLEAPSGVATNQHEHYFVRQHTRKHPLQSLLLLMDIRTNPPGVRAVMDQLLDLGYAFEYGEGSVEATHVGKAAAADESRIGCESSPGGSVPSAKNDDTQEKCCTSLCRPSRPQAPWRSRLHQRSRRLMRTWRHLSSRLQRRLCSFRPSLWM